ncbi:hypothetical protein [Bartonella tribocorum]|uniref:hypothetical protein n=1 Tax=Bartonella tribocorum TaxID=85701 RepID=UPI0011776FC6|nr:hypothetical protein [Bartonella tribocorum]
MLHCGTCLSVCLSFGAKRFDIIFLLGVSAFIGAGVCCLVETSLGLRDEEDFVEEGPKLSDRACFLFLKSFALIYLLGICLLGIIFGFAFAGAEHRGWTWLWLSKDWVGGVIIGFTSAFLYEGMRCVGVMAGRRL